MHIKKSFFKTLAVSIGFFLVISRGTWVGAADPEPNIVTGIGTMSDLLEAIGNATTDTDIYLDNAIVIDKSYDFAVQNPGGHTITIYPSLAPNGGWANKSNNTATRQRHFIVFGEGIEPTVTFDGNIILDGCSQNGGGIFIAGDFNRDTSVESGVKMLTLVNAVIQNCYAANNGGASALRTPNNPAIAVNSDGRGGAIGCTWFTGEPVNTSNLNAISNRNLIITGEKTLLNNNKGQDRGGAIQANHVTIEAGVISNNFATRYGGGINAYGGLIMNGGLITGNRVEHNNAAGGGISNYYGDIVINGGTISNNSAIGTYANGGGIVSMIFNEKPQPYANVIIAGDAQIMKNTASINGGGIQTNRLTITGGTISGNQTLTGDGGGAYTANLEMTGGDVADNHAAGNSGGVFISPWNPELSLSDPDTFTYTSEHSISGGTISGNTADRNGGGVYTGLVHYDASLLGFELTFHANLVVSNALISDNKAANGGGIFLNGALDVISGDFLRNEAEVDGGGIYTDDLSTLTIAATTVFFDNTAATAADAPLEIHPGRDLHLVNVLTDHFSINDHTGRPFSTAYNNYDVSYHLELPVSVVLNYYQDTITDDHLLGHQTFDSIVGTQLTASIVAHYLGTNWLNEFKPSSGYNNGIVSGGYPVVSMVVEENVINVVYVIASNNNRPSTNTPTPENPTLNVDPTPENPVPDVAPATENASPDVTPTPENDTLVQSAPADQTLPKTGDDGTTAHLFFLFGLSLIGFIVTLCISPRKHGAHKKH